MDAVENGITWLRREAISARGSVYSWRNADHEGFPYPEAAGLVLHLFAVLERPLDRAPLMLGQLKQQFETDGGYGKQGRRYLFDVGVVFSALGAMGKVDTAFGDALAIAMEDLIEQRKAMIEPVEESRWSQLFQPHLVKSCARLAAWNPDRRSIAGAAIPPLRDALDRGEPDYTHAFCYGLEGLLLHAGTKDEVLRRGLDRLTRLQQPNGLLPAFHGETHQQAPLRLDATAQAARLWIAVDRNRYAVPIKNAVDALLRFQHRSGGFPYEPESRDINSWVTVFAIQALDWSQREAVIIDALV